MIHFLSLNSWYVLSVNQTCFHKIYKSLEVVKSIWQFKSDLNTCKNISFKITFWQEDECTCWRVLSGSIPLSGTLEMDGCLSTIMVFSATFYCKNIFYGQYFRIWKQILKMVSWYNTASHSNKMTEHFESTPLLLCFLLNFFQPPQKPFILLYKCLWKKVHARTDRSLLRLFNWESWPESSKQQDTEAGAVKDIIQSSAQYLSEKV